MAQSKTGLMGRLGNHAYGVGFIAVVALLVALSIASFQKVFVPVVHVTLLTDRIGSQMQVSSDVKIRGLIVGEVRSIESTASGARLDLA
ncbi:MAG TPA: mammalian cell entry protein, partial [Pedococcus sp.]|nr:mammalian cell entry protein [Pedococcus sp.]